MHTAHRIGVALLALVLATVGCARASAPGAEPTGGGNPEVVRSTGPVEPARRPNIVLIITDDQRWDTLWAMPTVRSQLADRGITFSNGYVSNPLCCPSRASILTGQYSHTNGVYTNRGQSPLGGFNAFDDRSTVATWLDGAGYQTGLFGKYLNGYAGSYKPPGWDRWFATYRNGGFYDYLAADDFVMKTFGSDRGDYGTTVLAQNAVRFIESTPAESPLFMYFAPHAPREPATPAPGDRNAFADLPKWRPPSYDEVDVSDKPEYMQRRVRLDAASRAEIDHFRRSQYRSLLAVDRAVGELVDALERTDRLEDTLLVFMADNGMSWGEHRWQGKLVPYEESIRVPFVVRYDAVIRSPRTEDRLVLNIDLAPMFADLAGIPAPRVEGASLVPILADAGGTWRTDFLIEHLEKSNSGVPTYCGVHTERHVFVRYASGEEELYDLERDPAELVNVAADDRYAEIRREMFGRLRQLCDPAPPGLSL